MMLQHEGVFMARPLNWGIQESKDSQSVALVMEFLVTAKHENGNWEDWTQYEDQTITGYFYIVKRDGTVNQVQVKSVAEALGWDGSMEALLGMPPEVECQITVKNDEYQGKSRLKVQWINHASYTPGLQTAAPDEVKKLGTKFGSLLRAAAAEGAAANKAMQPKREVPKPAPSPVPAHAGGTDDEDDLPF